MAKQDGVNRRAFRTAQYPGMALGVLAALSQAYGKTWKDKTEQALKTVQWLEKDCAADRSVATGEPGSWLLW